MSVFVTVKLSVVQTCSNQRTEVRVSVCQRELLRMQISVGPPFKCKTVTGDGIHFLEGTTTKCYLDQTIALICCGRGRLSDGEFVKGLVCTNSTVSCGPVKYC